MRRLLLGLTILAMLAVFIQPAQAQTPTPPLYIRNMVRDMTPEERVGQLFLASFTGTDTSETSQVYDLIVNYHVGGVTLSAANDNFVASPETVAGAYQLTAQLQQIERDSSGQPIAEGGVNRAYVPLWIGVTQEGNGAPTDQILNGLTPLPSEMSLGATWQPQLAEQVGMVSGQELSALGFNMVFGPSLDVLEQPILAPNGDLGTRVFGGDPYWVSAMGQAYVRGLHAGSNGHLLVIARHFPGRGSSDRLPDVEVATVRKSLEQLKQIELAPFFAVTGNAPDAQAMADGLLISHLRIQGLLGNVRAITRPLSFDSQALSAILSLPEFSAWRDNGGLIVSDNLGSRAVRDFYTASGSTFNARLIARDAFLAGNDMLYLGDIVSSDSADNYSTVKQILEYFAQKYREDTAFATRVDEAVTRVLTRKYQLYGIFVDADPSPDATGLAVLNTSRDLTFRVAASAVTLVSPDPQELDATLPSQPVASDYMVFLTDTRTAHQCSTCPDETVFATDALQQSILRLYSQTAGGQVIPSHLTSYTFKDLTNLLNGTGGEFVEPDLHRATWVVISLADSSEGQPDLIRRLLSDRQDLLRNKKVILFSFGAPYYFDSTDISKLTAYFALYSKTSPFVDVAARMLFRELTPDGHSPVSIPGIGYDLISVTAPDPDQVISLFLDLPAAAPSPASTAETAEPTVVPQMRIGDTISIRTGELLDHNGNIVPDGTIVRFSISVSEEGGGLIEQQEAQTVRGVARISYRLAKTGLIEMRASSEPANVSQVLQLDVRENEVIVVMVTVTIPVVSETPASVTSTPLPLPDSDFVTSEGSPRFGGWLLILFVLAGGAWLASWVGGNIGASRWRVRWGLCALVGGLVAYNYMALGMPGASSTLIAWGGGALVGFTLLGQVFGAFAAWLWMRRSAR